MIGIIGYAVPTGLGIMVREIRKHLGISLQLTIANSDFDPPWNLDWAANTYLNGAPPAGPFSGEKFDWEVQQEDLATWIRDEQITTVIAIETPFGENTFRWCQEMGVRVVLIPMWEFFNPNSPQFRNVDLYLCPSFKCFQEIPFDNKTYLPYPVDTEAIPYRQRTGPAKVFVHNAGTGGMNGRKGTAATVEAFKKADVDARLIIRTLRPLNWIFRDLPQDSFKQIDIWLAADHERIHVREGTVAEVANLYSEGDVLIYPSKYDGHSLVGLEGMCAGMPVITTDAAPMNEFFPSDYPLLIPVAERKPAGLINPHCEMNLVDIDALAERIRYCATHDMSEISERNRRIVEREHSWTALKERWLKVLHNVQSQSVGRT